MRYKTLFRVLMKVIGVYFVAQSTPAILTAVLQQLWQIATTGKLSFDVFSPRGYPFSWIMSVGVLFVVGLYLFFGGKALADLAIPDNRLYCPECGYELASGHKGNCPECGFDAGDPATLGTL